MLTSLKKAKNANVPDAQKVSQSINQMSAMQRLVRKKNLSSLLRSSLQKWCIEHKIELLTFYSLRCFAQFLFSSSIEEKTKLAT